VQYQAPRVDSRRSAKTTVINITQNKQQLNFFGCRAFAMDNEAASRAIIFESLDNFELENAVFHAESLYAEVRAVDSKNSDPPRLTCCAFFTFARDRAPLKPLVHVVVIIVVRRVPSPLALPRRLLIGPLAVRQTGAASELRLLCSCYMRNGQDVRAYHRLKHAPAEHRGDPMVTQPPRRRADPAATLT